ncbi:hypothetical protein [Angustibacter luteus]|uniref:Carboxypeptidase regulatory-like domain-containing protein n=1 Tax=Angustibacter luteus TaxID=658456 RepID=A0ABW1JHS7_9ACTN
MTRAQARSSASAAVIATALAVSLVGALVGALVVLGPVAATASATSPSLTLSQSSGSPGDQRTISGSGWCANGDLSVGIAVKGTLDAPTRLFATTLDAGTFSRSFEVPQLVTGPSTISAVQSCVGFRAPRTAQVDFTVTSTYVLQLDRPSARPGTTVVATGENWDAAAGPVSLFLSADQASDPAKALTAATPQDGRFTAPFTTPDVTPGGYRLFACQLCDQPKGRPSQTVSFTITPRRQVAAVLSLAPASGRPGDAFAASGTGWSADDGAVSVFARKADLSHPGRALGRVIPAGGSFRLDLAVPSSATRGSHVFVACQRCGQGARQRSASATFVVTARPAIKPSIFLAPAAGRAGDAATLTGAGWRPDGGPVSVFASQADSTDATRALAVAQPAADGLFEIGFTVPSRVAGEYVLFACQSCGSAASELSATAALTIQTSRLTVGRVLLLVLALLAGAAAVLLARGLRGRRPGGPRGNRPPGPGPDPHLEPHAGLDAEVSSRSVDGLTAPHLRLVPHPDSPASTIDLEARR